MRNTACISFYCSLKLVIYTKSRGQYISFSVHTRDSNAACRLPVPTVLFSHPRVASQQHRLGKFLSKLRTTKPQRTKTWNCPQPVRSSWSNPRIVPGINPKPLSTSAGCKQPRHAWLTGAACVTWLYEHANRRATNRDAMRRLLLQGMKTLILKSPREKHIKVLDRFRISMPENYL